VSTGARPQCAVLGTGFGAFNVVKHLDRDTDVTVVSPRNHFLFTPLLPSTTVGTIEFRSIIEPIRHAHTGLRFYHAAAMDLDAAGRRVVCRGAADGRVFALPYDILVIAVGAVSNTFGVPGVEEHALFLRELADARALRGRIIECFERANLPALSAEERRRLLSFVVCGGGPTGVEFAAELNDFMTVELARSYPALVAEAQITVVEAARDILSTFDERLRRYALETFRRQRIRVLTESPVVRVEADRLHMRDGSVMPFGLLLWSTGNGPTPFVLGSGLPLDPRGRIITDGHLRVRGTDNLYAIGDCSVIADRPLPVTGQVAQQQGRYLGRALPRRLRGDTPPPFRYRNLGMLAYVGGSRALADLENYKGSGWTAWLFWRSVYVTKIVSLRNKVRVLTDWVNAKLFGRDTSKF
jgi:NADH:ubiquinone reductase (non-electrogenic)